MAWNEPGGNDKDPWGNRGSDNQGPPDLDEAFRKLQKSLSEMFGGGGSGSGSASSGLSGKMAALIVVAALIVYGLMGIYQVDVQERGIVLRFGKLYGGQVLNGLHWNPPVIDEVLIVNVTRLRSQGYDAEMLTEDENIVQVKMSVQYAIGDATKYLLRVQDPDTSLDQATRSALRHVVGSSEMHGVLTEGREELADKVKVRIQNYMDNYGTGIYVNQVNIDDTAPPEAVKAAFDDVIKAREDEVRVRNEADAYANQIVPEARGDAQRLLEEAEAYKSRVVAMAQGETTRFTKMLAEYKLAPEVTRQRIYLDTLEGIMENSTKVMIDVEGGNNLLYLPLDQLMQAAGAAAAARGREASSQPLTNTSQARQSGNRRERRQ
jgi:membrane protease subunit HflK